MGRGDQAAMERPSAVLPKQASGSAGDGAKGSVCALPRNNSGSSDCTPPLWCRRADVPPLHGSGYGWCTSEPRITSSASTLASTATTVRVPCLSCLPP